MTMPGKDFLDLGLQGKSSWRRYLLGLALAVVIWIFGSILTILPVLFMRAFQASKTDTSFTNDLFSLSDLNTHIPAVLMFVAVTAGFIFLILGLWLAL
jgi:hypothetical protein